MKVGLVLGAGGVMGGAWLTGGLDALAKETGWDPARADYIVGTSAGSMIGALLASGIPPWFMVAHSRGESFEGLTDAQGRPAAEAERSGGAVFRLHSGIPSPLPGSLGLAMRSLSRPSRHTPTALLAGWLPRGPVSTAPLSDQIKRVVPSGWSPHPGLWVVACDYSTGRRVPFGRADSPTAHLHQAVAASCAIPAFYRPVRIGDRDYVDGGVYSTSNLDLLGDLDLDLVICLNPTSTLHPPRAFNPAHWISQALQKASGRRLGSEASKLRERGVPVVLIQPTDRDLEAMGVNLMSGKRRNEAIESAQRTVAEQLRASEHGDLLAALPAGERVKIQRPSEGPEHWPDLIELEKGVREQAGR